MASAQEYEKLLNELQAVRKCVNAQKLSHQSTISQLEQSYNLNLQLQEVIKSQSSAVSSLNRQLDEKSRKLAEMSENYEVQLRELKEFVHVKEKELQGIRGALVVTDYDMIRLRIVGELELTHRQVVQDIEKQKDRLAKLWGDEKRMRQLVSDKYDLTKRQMEKQTQKTELEKQENQKKHMREINKLQQKLQMATKHNRQLEKLLEINQKRYQALQQKYQSQINKVYEQLKPSPPTYRSQSEVQLRRLGTLQANLQQKDVEIQTLKKKLKRQEVRNQEIVEQFQKKLKNVRDESISYEEHMRKLNQRDKEHEQMIKGYESRVKSMKESHLEQMRQARKQNERKLEEMRDKLRIQKQNNEKSSNYLSVESSPHFGAGRKAESPRKQRETERYQEQMQRLQIQNQRLKKQLRNASSRGKLEDNGGASVEQYKMKLQQANKQIVSLLLDKVNMKQEMSKTLRK